MDITKYVMSAIQKKHPLPDDIDIDTFNYAESGHVDSLGIVQFIVSLEDKFGIEFTDEDMAAPSFRTIGGMIRLIEGKVVEREKS